MEITYRKLGIINMDVSGGYDQISRQDSTRVRTFSSERGLGGQHSESGWSWRVEDHSDWHLSICRYSRHISLT